MSLLSGIEVAIICIDIWEMASNHLFPVPLVTNLYALS
jgi:hypothetical protein